MTRDLLKCIACCARYAFVLVKPGAPVRTVAEAHLTDLMLPASLQYYKSWLCVLPTGLAAVVSDAREEASSARELFCLWHSRATLTTVRTCAEALNTEHASDSVRIARTAALVGYVRSPGVTRCTMQKACIAPRKAALLTSCIPYTSLL
jgi:hypothetical protein